MSDLPQGWEWATLEELTAAEPRAITDGPFGSNLKSAHYVSSGPRVIRLQNIGFGEFIDEPAHISESHFEKLRAHEVRAGDLVVASLGQDLPRSCIVPPDVGPAIVKADCIRVRLHPDVDPRYVNYALQRPALRRAVAAQIHGVGRPRLGMTGIKRLSIPVAPCAEQRRIVAAIEEHLSLLGAAEVAVHSAQRRLGALSDAALHQLFDSTWPRVELDSVNVEGRPICYGILKPRTSAPGVVPYVEVRSIVDGSINVGDLRLTSKELHDAFPRSVLRTGDVVLAVRGSYDRAAVVPQALDGANVSRDVARISPTDDLLPEFLAAFLVSPEARRYFRQHARGVAVQGVNIGDLRRLPVPFPGRSEQEAALTWLRGVGEANDRLRADVQAAQTKTRQLRTAILATAFAGQLAPQHPNEESASLVLERIRTERVAAGLRKQAGRVKAL